MAHSRAHLLLADEGLALLRQWLTGDEEAVQARLEEILAIVQERDPALWEPVPRPELSPLPGYSAWAGTYDTDPNAILLLEEPAVQALLAGIRPGRVLDTACGTGRHTQFLAAAGHEVVGVDVTPAMLQRAREKAPGARFLLGDLEALPLQTASAEVVLCALALTHFPALELPLAELARVVRPGGRLILSDVHPLFVALGAHAAFRSADRRPYFVRNYVHLLSAYLAAFATVGLRVRQCLEPTFGPEEAGVLLGSFPEVARAAYVGLPGILIWDLEVLSATQF